MIKRIINVIYTKFIYLFADKLATILFYIQSIGAPELSRYRAGRNTFWVRKNTSDIYIIKEVFDKKTYGMKPQGVVFDIGANIGAFSVYAANSCDKVYAFEPESSNYKQLEENVSLNKMITRIKTFKIAIGKENKEIALYRGPHNKGASSLVHKVSNDKEVVTMKSLSSVINDNNIKKINLLKIDIEGGEYDLIYGMKSEDFDLIDAIILEYHFVENNSYRDLMTYLESMGYKVKRHKNMGLIIGTGLISARKSS